MKFASIACAAFAPLALAATAEASERTIAAEDMLWERVPKAKEVVAAFPQAAVITGATAVMSCTVTSSRTLTNCDMQHESHAGFGQALVNLASKYTAATQSKSGEHTSGARVTVALRWR